MSKKIYILLTLEGNYDVLEKDSESSEINFAVFSRCSWFAVSYMCDSGKWSASTANTKVIGFTKKEFNSNEIDLGVSFEATIDDDFYKELIGSDCNIKCRNDILVKSELNETTDIHIQPEKILLEVFFEKKNLTAKEKELFDRKIHTTNAEMLVLLSLMFRGWNNLSSLKNHKKFKEEYIYNKDFINVIIKSYDATYIDHIDYINEFKELLK